jgi:hypothetical protein
MTKSRGDMLADLAAAVNELVEPRHHVETYETEIDKGTRRRRTRRRHLITLPGLLRSLVDAMEPGATGEIGAPAGYESRPAAELEPANVHRMITDQSAIWCRAFGIQRETLSGRLRALVGARHTDIQLDTLTHEVQYWVRRARLATGWDAAPFTLNQPCPYCWAKNKLTITGDLEKARCGACGREWDEQTIGLLGAMLTANETQETMTAVVRCGWDDCYRIGDHDVHDRGDGRTWRDSCDVWPGTPVVA